MNLFRITGVLHPPTCLDVWSANSGSRPGTRCFNLYIIAENEVVKCRAASASENEQPTN